MSTGIDEIGQTEPLRLGSMAYIVIASAAASVYMFSASGGVINGTVLADFAAGYGPPYFAMLWARRDARSSGYWPAQHYGLWLWFLWFVALPHYFVKTRGRRGLVIAVPLLATLAAPILASILGWWFYEDLPDFR